MSSTSQAFLTPVRAQRFVEQMRILSRYAAPGFQFCFLFRRGGFRFGIRQRSNFIWSVEIASANCEIVTFRHGNRTLVPRRGSIRLPTLMASLRRSWHAGQRIFLVFDTSTSVTDRRAVAQRNAAENATTITFPVCYGREVEEEVESALIARHRRGQPQILMRAGYRVVIIRALSAGAGQIEFVRREWLIDFLLILAAAAVPLDSIIEVYYSAMNGHHRFVVRIPSSIYLFGR